MRRLLSCCALALLATSALADTPPAPAVAPPPPQVSEDAATSMPEPEVRIIQKGENKVEEYRVNGQLYMVKVTPSHGVPYYLMDDDGTGNLKQVDPKRRIIIPSWVLKRF